MKLLGKKVIVTGANRSIGQACAILFAKEGADVVISYRSDEKGGIETVKTIQAKGRASKAFHADFIEILAIENLFIYTRPGDSGSIRPGERNDDNQEIFTLASFQERNISLNLSSIFCMNS